MLSGKQASEGRSFHRRLLSEYNSEFTLGNYVSFYELRGIVKKIEALAKAGTSDERRGALEEMFFSNVQESHRHVSKFLREQEKAAEAALARLQEMNEDQVLAAGGDFLPQVYVMLETITRYRELNVAGFGKLFKKFFERCASDSLPSQKRVHAADKIVSESQLANPSFDADLHKQTVCAIFATVFKVSYETAVRQMELHLAKQRSLQHRILPVSESHFFSRYSVHRQRQGRYALRIITGEANPALSKLIGEVLHCRLTATTVSQFANGEVSVVLDEAVRGDDVYILQPMVAREKVSLSTSFMEIALLLQTCVHASAARISAVLPFLAYTKNTPSVSAVAEILVAMGCKHLITVDLQREQVEGMFHNVPVENLTARLEFIRYLSKKLKEEDHNFQDIVVVSPDSDNVSRAQKFADGLMEYAQLTDPKQFVSICTAVKRVQTGPSSGDSSLRHHLDIVGNVQNKLCVIIDCIIDEAINVANVALMLKNNGARTIIAMATHGIFSGESSVRRIVDSPIDEVVITDSINNDDRLKDASFAKKLRIIPIAPLLAQAIQKVHTENTLSTLFEK
jgi:ribose-phosphate pyrophosphokinase